MSEPPVGKLALHTRAQDGGLPARSGEGGMVGRSGSGAGGLWGEVRDGWQAWSWHRLRHWCVVICVAVS